VTTRSYVREYECGHAVLYTGTDPEPPPLCAICEPRSPFPDDVRAPTHEDECQHAETDSCLVCDDDEIQSLGIIRDRLIESVNELDDIEDRLNKHRRAADDPPQIVELHRIEDHVSLAWAHTRQALHILTEHLAVYPDAR
jgi:hypothetical protein